MPAGWAILALGALATQSVYSVSMKWLLTEEDATDPVLLSAAVFVLTGLIAAALWLALGDPDADLARLGAGSTPALCALDVALYVAAPVLYFRGMKALPVSQVAVLQACAGVFALAGGALLGLETPRAAHLLGAGLIVGAVRLVSGSGGGPRVSRPVLQLLGAAALYGAAALVDQRLVAVSGLSPAWVLTLAFLPPGLALLALSLAQTPARRATLARLARRRSLPVNAAALAMSYALIYRAYGLGGPASGVTLVLAAEAVVVVVLAALFLREREALGRRVLAGLVVAVGIVLVG